MLQINKINDLWCNFALNLGLNIALVPANMARLNFGPCKKK